MFYCKKIPLDELEEIQQGVLKLVPDPFFRFQRLFYLTNNKETFLSISALKKALDRLGLLDKINKAGFALNVVHPRSETPIHIDSGDFPYSFNIPITHCKDSSVTFYKLKDNFNITELETKVTPFGKYFKTEKSHCDIIEEFELSIPFIMNTKILHSVTNRSNDRRITLLVRLSENPFDIL